MAFSFRIGRYVAQILRDLETSNGFMSELFNGTEVMDFVSNHMVLARSILDAFDKKNVTEFKDSLVEAGLDPDAAEIFLEGFVNINRV